MGNPLSPILADIVMEKLFKVSFSLCTYKPTLILKYVDDILLIIQNNEIQKIKNNFETFNEQLKFTVEI